MRVCVVGAGVIGLTCAIRLAEAGNQVHVVAQSRALDSVSAVAAAMWFPYRAFPQDRVLAWSMASLEVFEALAEDRSSGVLLRFGTQLHRVDTPQVWWADHLTDVRRLGRADVRTVAAPNPDILGGLRARLPVIVMSSYLPWLDRRCAELGVATSWGPVPSVREADASADAVVIAAGLGSQALADDDEMVPIRGQIVRVGNPGLTDWLLDEDDPNEFCYVIPRVDDVVCGGTAEVGDSSLAVDPETDTAILSRARALLPVLEAAPVLSRAVGLRPGRSAVRLERCDELDTTGRPVVACYGHGGAGVTMSWGCAQEVAMLFNRL